MKIIRVELTKETFVLSVKTLIDPVTYSLDYSRLTKPIPLDLNEAFAEAYVTDCCEPTRAFNEVSQRTLCPYARTHTNATVQMELFEREPIIVVRKL